MPRLIKPRAIAPGATLGIAAPGGPVDPEKLAAGEALLRDADRPDQGLYITTTAAPVMVQLVPDGAIRISLGNAVLADEVVETFNT